MPAPIILTPPAEDSDDVVLSGPTRRFLREKVGDELGIWGTFTVSSTPSTATTPDAARQILCTSLGADGPSTDRLDGHYVYVRDGVQAGQQRRVLTGTFDGADASILLDRPFSAPLASGTALEVSFPLPSDRYLAIKGLNTLVDEALSLIWIEARLPFVGNGTYTYSLLAYPWLQRYEQTRGIYDTVWSRNTSVLVRRDDVGYRIVADGASRTLITDWGYTAADTFELAVLVRADRYVSDGTTWAYAETPGLLTDAYQAAADPQWVLAFAMARGLRFLSRWLARDRLIAPDERAILLADVTERRPQWARVAGRIKAGQTLDLMLPEPMDGMVSLPDPPGWV